MTDTAARGKVLVIDDELGPRESMRILLKREFDVFCADSVDAGLEIFKKECPDLVMLDLRMPGKGGIEALKAIRAMDAHVSTVILTGYGALETAQQALRLGANDYLTKPFEIGEMLKVVSHYVHRTGIERKRAEMLDELQHVNVRLVRDLSQKERLATVGEHAAEFAHDLRNPLTIVSGYVELLSLQVQDAAAKKEDGFGQLEEYLGVIEQNVQRCCQLSEAWQKFAKSGASEFANTDIDALMNDVAMGVTPLASTSGVEVEHIYKAGDVTVHGNAGQLLRAIHNIACNAVQAVPPGQGSVQIVTTSDCANVHIRVIDTGCGMSDDVREHIFDPYFTTKKDAGGTGLGMVIAKRIVEEHGGTIDLSSAPGKGTTVAISLPIRTGAVAAATTG